MKEIHVSITTLTITDQLKNGKFVHIRECARFHKAVVEAKKTLNMTLKVSCQPTITDHTDGLLNGFCHGNSVIYRTYCFSSVVTVIHTSS